MRDLRLRWPLRAALLGGACLVVLAALAGLGQAVSPTATPAASQQYARKVTICHYTHSKKNPYRTIRVSRSAVRAHQRHGDGLGTCSKATLTLCHKLKGTKKRATIRVKGAKRAAKHVRHGDKAGKCKVKSKKKKK